MASTVSGIFHLSMHVHSLSDARRFYGDILGCTEGRSTSSWVDFDFFGHQLSLHLGTPQPTANTGEVDGVAVPMPHFGAVLPLQIWNDVAGRLRDAGVRFVLDPQQRNVSQVGAQQTLFVLDPSNNAIEFKSMNNHQELFAQ